MTNKDATANSLYYYLKQVKLLRSIVSFIRRQKNNFRQKQYWQDYKKFLSGKHGIEIGGPSNIFGYIYSQCASCNGVNFSADTTWWQDSNNGSYTFQNKKLGKVYISDAVNMSCVESNSYDFLLSSNNLEHIANPLKALKEFQRVIKSEGLMIILVPMKSKCFDHRREYTRFEHMLQDYENNTPETDLTHLDEILELHDS